MRKPDQVRLAVYIVRHVVGVAFFVWILWQAIRSEQPLFALIFGGLTLGYAGFAAFTAWRMYQVSRRRSLAENVASERNAA